MYINNVLQCDVHLDINEAYDGMCNWTLDPTVVRLIYSSNYVRKCMDKELLRYIFRFIYIFHYK